MLSMNEQTLQSIYPTATTGSFQVSYNSNQPEFLASVFPKYKSYFHFFGWFVVIYIILFYFIRGVIVTPKCKDKGQIIAHILFLKTPALILFPSYS